jgi:hypothetical protein
LLFSFNDHKSVSLKKLAFTIFLFNLESHSSQKNFKWWFHPIPYISYHILYHCSKLFAGLIKSVISFHDILNNECALLSTVSPPLTFKEQGSLHSPVASLHAWHFSECWQCLLEQETQTSPLWVPPEGLVFILSNDVIYDSPGFNIVYGQTWRLGIRWQAKYSRPLSEVETYRSSIWKCSSLVFWQLS